MILKEPHTKFFKGTFPNNNKQLFLVDRDSTIIADEGYTHKIDDLVFLPNVLLALKFCKESGIEIAIATNQRGVAIGKFTVDQMDTFNLHLVERIKDLTGLEILAVACCTHDMQEFCNCRKPNPGMLLSIVDFYKVPLDLCVMFGDSESDLEAGRRAGMRSKKVTKGQLHAAFISERAIRDS